MNNITIDEIKAMMQQFRLKEVILRDGTRICRDPQGQIYTMSDNGLKDYAGLEMRLNAINMFM